MVSARFSLLLMLVLIGMGLPYQEVLAQSKAADILDRQSGANMPPRLPPRPDTTFEKFLPLAVAGDDKVQNFLGYMFFYGEGVEQNFVASHNWFHLAAEQGNVLAQRNLGLFHLRANPMAPQMYHNVQEAKMWFEMLAKNMDSSQINSNLQTKPYSGVKEKWEMQKGELQIGERIFGTFCSGCHGVDGKAVFAKAPSFAMGDSLTKNDQALLDSLSNGKGTMPPWRGTLSDDLLKSVLQYIRTRFANVAKKGKLSARSPVPNSKPNDSRVEGQRLFLKFCSGCHGFNGIAFYVNSPSFALGQRMHKSDFELSESIRNGKGQMPGWGNMLDAGQISSILGFVRTLQDEFNTGIAKTQRFSPDLYFRFRPAGEISNDWLGADPASVIPQPSR